MFSSLDRADIQLEAGPDGQQRFVQTDHRRAAEIEQEPELSIIFALVRIMNPKRIAEAGSPEPIVFYSAQELPPEFLSQAIHAAGAGCSSAIKSSQRLRAQNRPDWRE